MKGTTSLEGIAARYNKDPRVLGDQVAERTGGQPVESVKAISTGTGVDVFEVVYGKGGKLSVFVNPNSGQALVREAVGEALAEAA